MGAATTEFRVMYKEPEVTHTARAAEDSIVETEEIYTEVVFDGDDPEDRQTAGVSPFSWSKV